MHSWSVCSIAVSQLLRQWPSEELGSSEDISRGKGRAKEVQNLEVQDSLTSKRAVLCVANKLMLVLGYNEYIIQGDDWGYYISKLLITEYGTKTVKAWHTNMPVLTSTPM
ncbi:predicted protein [Postia placenta Mad-698-R]|nr:predicted protein [Postia placenta Mad-698-R]